MSRRWQRKGLLVPAPTGQPWSHSHAALPVPEVIDDSAINLYYSPRDHQGRAHVAMARIQAPISDDDLRLVEHHPEPILNPGPLGAFDDSGVTVSCLVHAAGASYLYYTGWTLGVTVPFYFYAGLAIREEGATHFERVSAAPILERSAIDPYLTASPWVTVEDGQWRMWYVSCTGWQNTSTETKHFYHLRYAESSDGISWSRDGRVSIDFADDKEYAISRPCVVRDEDRYRMWFAIRGDRYRLGYAESLDGIAWTRDDSLTTLDGDSLGWDCEMQAYPAVFDLPGRRYLLYNGNGYGQTGIGYAVSHRSSAESLDP